MHKYVELHQKLTDLVKRSAETVVPLVIELVRPTSVLDVGCGNGTWLAAFRAAGVSDVLGIDGDYIDRAALEVPAAAFQPHDLQAGFDLKRRFDLVVCLEVAEHLEPVAAERLVDSLVKHADAVVFSAAIPGQGGVGHVNEQWQSHWVEQFRRRNFRPVDVIRPQLWTDPTVAYWYAQNTILYAVEASAVGAKFPASSMPWDVVHPVRLTAVMKALKDAETVTIRQGVGAVVGGLKKRLGRR